MDCYIRGAKPSENYSSEVIVNQDNLCVEMLHIVRDRFYRARVTRRINPDVYKVYYLSFVNLVDFYAFIDILIDN